MDQIGILALQESRVLTQEDRGCVSYHNKPRLRDGKSRSSLFEHKDIQHASGSFDMLSFLATEYAAITFRIQGVHIYGPPALTWNESQLIKVRPHCAEIAFCRKFNDHNEDWGDSRSDARVSNFLMSLYL